MNEHLEKAQSTASLSRNSRLAIAALAAGSLLWLAGDMVSPDILSLGKWRTHHSSFLELVRAYPVTAALLLFLSHVLLAALALPGASLLMLAAGSAFGPLAGTLICLTACTFGATLTMLAVRHLLRPWVMRKWGGRLADIEARFSRDGPACLFSLRLLPIVPFALVNAAAGLTCMTTWTFVWISFVGMLAATFVYVNAGTQLARIDAVGDILSPQTLISLALIALLPWAAKLLARALEKRSPASLPRTLVLFNYDWDRLGFFRWQQTFPVDSAGFDLFTFPSNTRLACFDLQRFVDRLARKANRKRWQAVTSNHEQFGALAAAMLAERMGWPGTPVTAVLACQHKLHARHVLQAVAPEANTHSELLPTRYGEPIPDGIDYPVFVKPVKAAFSILARQVDSRDELTTMTRFGTWERWVIRHLVEPFERIVAERLPQAGSAHRLMLETPAGGQQYNLDGYVFAGELRTLGFVESVMYPGTQSFMRFVYPCSLPTCMRERAVDVARRFLHAVGFTHGLFNMEFFYDEALGRLTVIEFNPRMAAQFSDLYLRVDGVDPHRVALALAHGNDPQFLPRAEPGAGVAASFVYRSFDPATAPPPMPNRRQRHQLAQQFPDAMLFCFAKTPGQIARDFRWLGSYRYGILHLGGNDAHDLRARCEVASRLLDWPVPYADAHAEPAGHPPCPLPALSLESSR